MFLSVSMRVSPNRVCLGGNLGTTSFSDHADLNSTPTNNQRGEQAAFPKISERFALSWAKGSNTRLGGLLPIMSVAQ